VNAAGDRFYTVVFDLGGVLIDWNPRHLCRRLFGDEAAMERFLAEVCTMRWNEQQDAGRSWDEAIATLSAQHSQHAGLIAAYRARWDEMLGGPLAPSVAVLDELRGRNLQLYALTNWSHETFPVAWERYDFLHRFVGVMVSGQERLLKPDPAIFRRLLSRFGLLPQCTIYIDDVPRNVDAARRLGMRPAVSRRGHAARRALRGRRAGCGGRRWPWPWLRQPFPARCCRRSASTRSCSACAVAGGWWRRNFRWSLRRRRIQFAAACANWPRRDCASVSTAAIAPQEQRRGEQVGRKLALARKAVSLVRQGQVLLIDAGSTNAAIAAALPERMGLIVITNAPDIVLALIGREGFEILLLGGRIDPWIGGAVGAQTLQELHPVRADLCFPGACAIDADSGLWGFDSEESQLRRAMVEASGETVVVATSDKLDAAAMHRVAAIDEVQHLVVEHDVGRALRATFSSHGLTVHRADTAQHGAGVELCTAGQWHRAVRVTSRRRFIAGCAD